MEREINVIEDLDGKKIVIIDDIRFKGRQAIDWDDVEIYLKEYVGAYYEVIETSDKVFIGSDFPFEFKGSNDTGRLKGTAAKAKANSALGIPMLLKCATNKRWQENFKTKHQADAKYGWYRFTSRFALPVYKQESGELDRYNVFRIEMLIRHAADDNLYLYDMVNIKKKRVPRFSLGCTVTNSLPLVHYNLILIICQQKRNRPKHALRAALQCVALYGSCIHGDVWAEPWKLNTGDGFYNLIKYR